MAETRSSAPLSGVGPQVAIMATAYATTLVMAIVVTRLIVGGPM
ncbi:hypothetical protein F4561_003113 [Lipingzhangella halophila]|uniref:Uncharacterized protein n=1 Tax=Lipingzhangella halophila TaxID=1783352 RepID=A0A7W7W3A5_9ACTN|nr:hypothetical protein [Lipingzhangella halophila]MBB4932293.1 hypothetical protein [Lipingzhangella halophila]